MCPFFFLMTQTGVAQCPDSPASLSLAQSLRPRDEEVCLVSTPQSEEQGVTTESFQSNGVLGALGGDSPISLTQETSRGRT